ncbi:hypothetical protein ABE65_018960 [Fictibacillus phosphorivorans]|uniref:DUF4176 domain-containing protein n=1 Tax=Fictibacillus phosphorivorans TaxID=1221500 RepID=A0A160IR31_9BACL|nr:DUF4176 domain-containing protein [Fictibacillus phosphorivorans]ANC78766.1 hypothetical protein ABE65_018960 [Fictibacillus phosphorivorans]
MSTEINSLKLDKGSELLPIGTIVLLDKVDQPLMIYGRLQQQMDLEKTWDYVSCPYPQGNVSDETNVFFNHDQINEIVFKGLETEGEKLLKEKLKLIKSGL